MVTMFFFVLKAFQKMITWTVNINGIEDLNLNVFLYFLKSKIKYILKSKEISFEFK